MKRTTRKERMDGRLWPAVAIAIALYAAASLWPYDWQWPEARRQRVVNAAEPLPGGGVRFRGTGIALGNGSPPWLDSAMKSQKVELSLTVRSLSPEQFGPARIFTLSRNPFERNLTIAQEGADLILRLRTPWTDANGTIGGRPVAGVQDLFLTSDWVDLQVSIEPHRLEITVGDQPVVEKALPPRPLGTWDSSHRLALGNELTYDRPWLGEIRRAVVRVGDHAIDHADASRLEFPPTFVITKPFPKLVPLRDLNRVDAIQNLAFYFPLGLVLGFLLGMERR
ncbi:MAG: hypothetical protein ACREK3_01670, partial [Gemmatimonadota bacterium]